MSGWIGVDLDRTLATYTGWKGEDHIGDPILPMVERIKGWLEQGIEVRIFTARWADKGNRLRFATRLHGWLRDRCGLPALKITNEKDYGTIEIWDDIAVGLHPNTGEYRLGPTGRDH